RPEDPRLVPVLARLEERGLVVDEAEEEWRRAARARTRVHLVGPPDWCARLAEHVAASGPQLGTAPADLTVLLSVGEPVREQVDELTHGGEPLLLLAAIEPRLRLGPFVLPGVTACLRCVDAHLAAGDPRRVPAPPHSPPGLPLDLSPVLI